MSPTRCALPLSVLLLSANAAAAPSDARALDRIEVRSARVREAAPFDLPAAISTIDADAPRARADVSLSELLDGVPGLLARERQNYAQDTQLSIRGQGARATFGVRGLRLAIDGIPATLPDGQGQISHASLAAAARVEVMRGPFSALHGNSSGGVVQLWSAEGEGATEARLRTVAGPDQTWSVAARVLGGSGRVGYHVAASGFDTDGYREHGAARRESGNALLRFDVSDATRLRLVANHFDSPEAQDPLGLTRTQARADPRQATSVAQQFDTRKSVRQDQLGLSVEQDLGAAQQLRAAAYGGARDVVQFLALPAAAQSNPLSGGGVIDLAGDYAGADVRWSWLGTLAGGRAEFSLGVASERQDQHRRGFENFVGSALGVRGALRRDERNRVRSNDEYAQLWWRFAPRWSLLAGARHSRVRFRAEDDYVRAGNPDDSGAVDYARTTPVAGLSFAPHEALRVYASYGRGFETPTFNELGYRADGGAGLAFDLRPAVSRNLELGMKWRGERGATLEGALFRADTDDELAVARNVGGRSSFRNVGRARRGGFELAATLPLVDTFDLSLAYTRLDARFRDTFPICSGTGCTTPTLVVPAGTRIPGTARDQAFARLQWQPAAWSLAAELAAVGAVSVNDAGSERAPGHALLHLELARAFAPGAGRARAFARLDNLLDKRHVGSVIVNEGNARYYEPGTGRGLWLGVEWNLR
jgi:iron complex outermembrane receptor protein